MRHVVKALLGMNQPSTATNYINIENTQDIKGVPAIVKFTIQSDPISEVGENGCQARDMLEYVKCLFESLDDAFPCRENELTIENLDQAISWQDARTADREKRKVEGKNIE